MALNGFLRFLEVLNFGKGSGRSWLELWLSFLSSGFIYSLLDCSGPF